MSSLFATYSAAFKIQQHADIKMDLVKVQDK